MKIHEIIHLIILSTILVSSCTPQSANNKKKISEDILFGKYSPDKQEHYTTIPEEYAIKKTMFIQKEAMDSFIEMAENAKTDGIDLYIVSSFRSFNDQRGIWEGKFTGQRKVEGKNLLTVIENESLRSLKILEYSAFPGGSRHHWGTDIDIVFKTSNIQLINEEYEKGYGAKVYSWLNNNAGKFGFCQPYYDTPENRNKGTYQYGHKEEKWHWSYIPVAKRYYNHYILNQTLLKPHEFAGADSIADVYIEYVGNVNKACQ